MSVFFFLSSGRPKVGHEEVILAPTISTNELEPLRESFSPILDIYPQTEDIVGQESPILENSSSGSESEDENLGCRSPEVEYRPRPGISKAQLEKVREDLSEKVAIEYENPELASQQEGYYSDRSSDQSHDAEEGQIRDYYAEDGAHNGQY